MAGKIWDKPYNLVFTNEVGQHLSQGKAYKNFKQIVTEMGLSKVRFHDLLHPHVKHMKKICEIF